MDSDAIRLNWGCGPERPEGWFNSDVMQYGPPDDHFHQGDIVMGLPWPDGFFEGAVAHHSLQSLAAWELDHGLNELHRVIRPGGWLRITVPDVIAAFVAWEHADVSWPGFEAITDPWGIDRKFAHYLTWGGFNRTTFTRSTLADAILRAGFRQVEIERAKLPARDRDGWPAWLFNLDSRLGESIVAMAMV